LKPHSLYTNSAYLLSNNLLSSLLGFVFWTLATRLYTTAEIGLNSVIINATSYAALLATAGLNFALVRFYHEAEDKRRFVNTYFTAAAALGVAITVVFLLGLEHWAPMLTSMRGDDLFIVVVFVTVLLNTASPILNAILIATRAARYLFIRNTVFGIAKIALLLVFTMTLGITVAWCAALLASVLMGFVWLLPKVLARYRMAVSMDVGQVRNTLRYIGGSYFSTLFATTPVLLVPMLVAGKLGVEANAYSYVAWMVANLLYAVPASVSYILFSEGAANGTEMRANMRRCYRMCTAFLLPGLLAIYLLGEWALGIFGVEYAANSAQVLKVLALAVVPLVFTYTATSIYRVKKRMGKLVVIWGSIAAVTLAMGYVLLPIYGIVGMGYAWLGANLIVLPILIREVKL